MGFKLISQTDEGLKALIKIRKGLIRKVLKDNDVIKHILYSPIGPLKRAPFGVQGRLWLPMPWSQQGPGLLSARIFIVKRFYPSI